MRLTQTRLRWYDYTSTKGYKIMNFFTVMGYIGAMMMAIFAFSMHLPAAILGLILLTIQAVDSKMWNLVILNLISIGGFLTNYMGAL